MPNYEKRTMTTENTAPATPATAEEELAPEKMSEAEAYREEAEAEEVKDQDDSLAEGLRNDLRRLQAEYVNYRARVERDRSVAAQVAREKTISTLLPVLDDINAARNAGDLVEGPFASIANKLEHILAQQGVTRVADVDVEFDPSIHEAMTRAPHPEIAEDNVSMVINDGYFVGEKLIRAARVVVSAGA